MPLKSKNVAAGVSIRDVKVISFLASSTLVFMVHSTAWAVGSGLVALTLGVTMPWEKVRPWIEWLRG